MRTTQRGLSSALKAVLLAGAGLCIASAAQAADPMVKACAKDGQFIIGFSQANNAEPYRQHVNDELTAAAK
ncbi:MAG: ABC transporter substrate-binding protein, partial [Mesorhizobium sp.]